MCLPTTRPWTSSMALPTNSGRGVAWSCLACFSPHPVWPCQVVNLLICWAHSPFQVSADFVVCITYIYSLIRLQRPSTQECQQLALTPVAARPKLDYQRPGVHLHFAAQPATGYLRVVNGHAAGGLLPDKTIHTQAQVKGNAEEALHQVNDQHHAKGHHMKNFFTGPFIVYLRKSCLIICSSSLICVCIFPSC